MATTRDAGGPDATVIGPSILISGKLSGDEDLTVRGRVEGELALSRTLIVETSGIVKADVSVRNAVISGVVVGNITATESVELTREGRMVGDIRAPRVIIVDGASFRGRVDMGNAEPSARTHRPATSAPRPATTTTSRTSAPSAPPKPPPPPTRVEKKAEARPPAPPPKPESRPLPPPAPNLAAQSRKKLVVRKKGR